MFKDSNILKGRRTTKLLGMPANEALELILFIVFLAGALGAIFRERFLYVVFAFIAVLMIYEGYRRKKEREIIERRFDRAILHKREEAGLLGPGEGHIHHN